MADLPINPEPEEYPKIKRAFRAARFMTWIGRLLLRLAFLFAILLGYSTRWYWGVVFFAVIYGLLLMLNSKARCPRCGAPWSGPEFESFVCRQCRLNIGMGLRDSPR
jgi:hypothetical protein